jgi:hypothetical protein
MQPPFSPTSTPRPLGYRAPRGELGRGILAGFVPLVRLIVMLIVAFALPLVARLVTGSQSFAVQQSAAVIAFAVGLVLAAIVYAVSLVGAFGQLRAWREDGRDISATSALWMLALTALIVALPIIVAAVLPQHPAP